MQENSQTAADRLNRIVEMFAAVPASARLEALLDYSRRLPELPERLRDHTELLEDVPECRSPFALIAEGDAQAVRLHFMAPREAPTMRGFACILHEALDGSPAQEILEVPNDFYRHMGLQEAVSAQRMTAMSAIFHRLKAQVSTL